MSLHSTTILSHIHAWATVAPLLGSVFAPFSVLFDIPALTEPWFIHTDPTVLLDPNTANGVPDNTASIILSGVGLGFNVIANALLIVRFSTSAQWWRVATRLSLVFWISKVIIALVNLCVFGRMPLGTSRGEGFWCAVISLIICGIIAFLLISHWVFEFKRTQRREERTGEQLAVRVAGRHFMLNVTLFVVDVAVLALLTSRVEHWTYLQGLYYSVITFLTIGFGDLYPTHTVTRILLFVFAILGIAQLGNIVSMLVGFFSSRADEKRAASRAEFERKRQQEEERKQGAIPDLNQEIEFLHRLGEQQEARIRAEQLAKSLAGLVIFWVVGAAIFSHLEGWAFGTAMYFGYASLLTLLIHPEYISFLTIGYGDFAPITPAGRVVFVLYSLIAVPIMASFAVQAVQQVFSALSERQYDRTKAKRGVQPIATSTKPRNNSLKPDEEENVEGASKKGHKSKSRQGVGHATFYGGQVISHAELAEHWHREWEERVQSHREEGFGEGTARELADQDTDAEQERANIKTSEEAGDKSGNPDADDVAEAQEQEREFDEDAQLTERILELAISLEWRARKLLIMHLGDSDGGKAARIVLKADRNVQLREVRGLVRDMVEERKLARRAGEGKREALDENISGDTALEDTGKEKDGRKDEAGSTHSLLDGVRNAPIFKHILSDDPDKLSFPSAKDDLQTLEDVRQYREDFAGLLAAGSRLMGLKGNERALFERRRLKELQQRKNGA